MGQSKNVPKLQTTALDFSGNLCVSRKRTNDGFRHPRLLTLEPSTSITVSFCIEETILILIVAPAWTKSVQEVRGPTRKFRVLRLHANYYFCLCAMCLSTSTRPAICRQSSLNILFQTPSGAPPYRHGAQRAGLCGPSILSPSPKADPERRDPNACYFVTF